MNFFDNYPPTAPPATPIPTPAPSGTLQALVETGATLNFLPIWVGAGLIGLGALAMIAGRARRAAKR